MFQIILPFVVKSADLYALSPYNYSTWSTPFLSLITTSTYKLKTNVPYVWFVKEFPMTVTGKLQKFHMQKKSQLKK
jgi:acyl-coenzyme A synthetase/AMP-(fatty) acid ligase